MRHAFQEVCSLLDIESPYEGHPIVAVLPTSVDLLLAGDGIFDLFTLNPKIKVHDTIMSLVGTAQRSRLREEAASVEDGHLMLDSLAPLPRYHF